VSYYADVARSRGLMTEALPVARLGITAVADPLAAIVVGTLPLAVDLVLYRGDDFYLDVTVTNSSGGAFDLTGFTAASQVRVSPDEPDPPAATFTATIAANVIHLHLPHGEADALPVTGAWDVQIKDATGVVTTLAFGAVTTTPDVTRP